MQVNQHQAGIQSSHRPPVAIHDAVNQQKNAASRSSDAAFFI